MSKTNCICQIPAAQLSTICDAACVVCCEREGGNGRRSQADSPLYGTLPGPSLGQAGPRPPPAARRKWAAACSCALLHSVLVKLPLCQLVETSRRQLQLSELRVGRALLVCSGPCIDQWGLAAGPGHPAPGGPRPLTDHQLHFYIFRQCRFSPSPHFHPVSYPSPGTKPQFLTTSDQHCIASCPHRPKSACCKLTI